MIAGGSTLLSLLLGVPAGYALARSTSPRAVWLAYFFLIVRMVPPVAALIPFYLMMRDIGLLGTLVGRRAHQHRAQQRLRRLDDVLLLPRRAGELEEAALTDGCSDFGAFFKIALPAVVARPHRLRALLHDVLVERLPLPDVPDQADTKPISVALLSAYGTKDITWGTLGALAHFSTMPIVLMLLLNRYFVQGLTQGVH